ncbi:hypothetical protein AAIR98_001189 [Elusimicrobium simillimum]|uniref:aminoacetone oxidase family FAD-binding enzyme n=1 Tax=Elusimicrobium simillimum TaxID=3143438 RepID=UPI003C700B6A
MHIYNTVIIGAGASGLSAAAYSGSNTLIIDHNSGPGKKILISGGGACNFSNKNVSAADYNSHNPHFCKSALAGFKPSDFTVILDKHHVGWQEREKGQYFGFNAKDILDTLAAEARAAGAEFLFNTKVYGVEKENDIFIVKTAGKPLHAKRVIVATGGLSMPRIGASGVAYDIAKSFSLNVTELYPALTPFLWDKADLAKFEALAGISAPVTLKLGKKTIKDSMLFTHYGISGPAALQMSLYSKGDEALTINFLPDTNIAELIAAARKTPKTFSQILDGLLPERLVTTLTYGYDQQVSNAKRETLQHFERTLTAYTFTPLLNTSYLKAEITAGEWTLKNFPPLPWSHAKYPDFILRANA